MKTLAIHVRQQLFLDPSHPVGILKRAIFYLRAMEGLIEKGRYCLAQVMISTPADWALLPLPGPLFPFYLVEGRPNLVMPSTGSIRHTIIIRLLTEIHEHMDLR